VKTGKIIIEKFMILSLLVLYLFMVVTYIFYLPKYTATSVTASVSSGSRHFQQHPRSPDYFAQGHCAFKSLPENKRKTITFLLKTASLIFLLIFSGKALRCVAQRYGAAPMNFFSYAHRYFYLDLCKLRI
jgi:hypothetical protein